MRYQAEIYVYDSITDSVSLAATTRYVRTMREAYDDALKEQEFYTRLGMLITRVDVIAIES